MASYVNRVSLTGRAASRDARENGVWQAEGIGSGKGFFPRWCQGDAVLCERSSCSKTSLTCRWLITII